MKVKTPLYKLRIIYNKTNLRQGQRVHVEPILKTQMLGDLLSTLIQKFLLIGYLSIIKRLSHTSLVSLDRIHLDVA